MSKGYVLIIWIIMFIVDVQVSNAAVNSNEHIETDFRQFRREEAVTYAPGRIQYCSEPGDTGGFRSFKDCAFSQQDLLLLVDQNGNHLDDEYSQ